MSDIVLGADPRELPLPALVRAADEAERRGARLRLVTAVPLAVPLVRDRLWNDASAYRISLRSPADSAPADVQDRVHEETRPYRRDLASRRYRCLSGPCRYGPFHPSVRPLGHCAPREPGAGSGQGSTT